jgi:hypothetical protein
MQKYGLIVADNGSDMYVTGTFDTRWNNDILNPAFALLTAADFEVVQLGWNPVAGGSALASLSLSPTRVVGGTPATGTVTLSAAAAGAGAVVQLNVSNTNVASVPASVTVAPGSTTATFAVGTRSVRKSRNVSVSASWQGKTVTSVLAVAPR